MANLTEIEQAVLAAFDNESMTCTKQEREEFVYQVRAWINAASYADQDGFSVADFRATITKLSGVALADTNQPEYEVRARRKRERIEAEQAA